MCLVPSRSTYKVRNRAAKTGEMMRAHHQQKVPRKPKYTVRPSSVESSGPAGPKERSCRHAPSQYKSKKHKKQPEPDNDPHYSLKAYFMADNKRQTRQLSDIWEARYEHIPVFSCGRVNEKDLASGPKVWNQREPEKYANNHKDLLSRRQPVSQVGGSRCE